MYNQFAGATGGFYGTPYQGNFGTYGAYQMPNPSMTIFKNALSAEDIQSMRKKENQFSFAITDMEYKKHKCNHRNEQGTGDTLNHIGDDTYHCYICDRDITFLDPMTPDEEIHDHAQQVVNMCETIKFLWRDQLTPDAVDTLAKISAMTPKLEYMFIMGRKHWIKLSGSDNFRNNRFGQSTLDIYNNMSQGMNINPNFGFMGGYNQMGMGQPQPNMYGQPMGQPNGGMMMGMGQPQPNMYAQQMAQPNGGYNPMGMGQPQQQQAYTPDMQGYQYNPQQSSVPVTPQTQQATATPTAQPVATVAPATPNSPEVVTASTTFKA